MATFSFLVGSFGIAACSWLLASAVFASLFLGRAFTSGEVIFVVATAAVFGATATGFMWHKLKQRRLATDAET